jgi:hypothetical protein
MQKVSIDTMGPFPVDKAGNIYVVVTVDCFSRYVELYPAPDCTADAAAQAITEHVATHGSPETLLSDNGPQYANRVIDALAELLGVELKKTIAYSHEENGISERANKEVLRHLRAILFDKDIHDSWSTCLPLVKRILNATPHGTTKVAPASIITPCAQLNAGLTFPHKTAQVNTFSEFLSTLQAKQALIIRLARTSLERHTSAAIARRKRDTQGTPLTEFAPGTYVLLAPPEGTRNPSKLNTPWQGPFLVVGNKGPQYTLDNLTTGRQQVVHVSRLKEFICPRGVSPLDIARRDTNSYIVESIISHTGNVKNRSSLLFRVRWLGYGASDDTHESLQTLRNNKVLHAYLRQHKLEYLLPPAFQDSRSPSPPDDTTHRSSRRRVAVASGGGGEV